MSLNHVAPPEAVRSQLERILRSPGFAGSPRLCRFLRYLVEQKLDGKAESIKEYSVGLEVFDRPPSFDPKTDSIVRASARTLRGKLTDYYQGAGASDSIVIAIPKGGYVPEFQAVAGSVRRRIWPAVAAATLILTAWSALGWRSGLPDAHPSVAVLEVTNASGNANDTWLSTALAEMITEDLSANEGLQAVSGEQVAQVQRDLAPAGMRAQIRERGPELQDRLGARFAVLADFRLTESNGAPALQVDTRLQRLRDGRIVLSTSDRGSEAQLYNLGAQIARKIRLALGVPRGEQAARNGPDRDSMRLYSEAVGRLRASDPLGARGLLERSVRADPSNFMARSMLAETYVTLGMDAPAKIEAQGALALAPPLPPVERLGLEARCQGALRDYPAAILSYRKLRRISPEVPEYGFNLAEFQERSGREAEALQTLRDMRATALSPADQARLDFAESAVLAKTGEYRKALALVRQCAEKARRLDARYLYACARLREGGLLMDLLEPNFLPALDEGLAICRGEGYRTCELNGLRQEGNYFAPSDPKRAMGLYSQGAAVARRIGNRRGLVEVLRGMAYVASRQFLDKEAEERYRELVQFIQDESLSDKTGEQVDLAELLVAEGRLDEGDRFLRRIRSLNHDFGWNLCWADIERNRGEYASAERRVARQVETARKTDDPFSLSVALEHSFWIHLDEGDLRRVGAEMQEIERLRPSEPLAPYLRAELALAQAKWGEAARHAGEARLRLKGVDRGLEAAIAIVRAEALTGAGHPGDALRALDEIAPILEPSRRVPLQIRARVCRFRAQALLGACPVGAQFGDLWAAARKLGFPSLVRDAERAGRLMRAKCGTAVYAARRDAR